MKKRSGIADITIKSAIEERKRKKEIQEEFSKLKEGDKKEAGQMESHVDEKYSIVRMQL